MKLSEFEPKIIYIDARVGSKELQPYFQKRGFKTEITHLESADFAISCGHTRANPYCKGDQGCRIGYERKTLSDLVGSLTQNRLGGHQIPLMLRDYTLSRIVIEDIWKCDEEDIIQVLRYGKWQPSRGCLTFSQLMGWLERYKVTSGGKLHIWQTSTMAMTAAYVGTSARWWWKEWHKHQLSQIDKMPVPEKALMWMPDDLERTAAAWTGIGVKKVRSISKHFGTIYEMTMASPKRWQEAGLSKNLAWKIFSLIRADKNERAKMGRQVVSGRVERRRVPR